MHDAVTVHPMLVTKPTMIVTPIRVTSINFFLLILIAGCQTVAAHRSVPGTVQHLVIFWLNDAGDQDAADRVIEVSKRFTTIPGVLHVSVGTVLPSHRDIVDSTFDVALAITFKNPQAMIDYLDHPLHKTAVETTLKPLVRRLVVYDFVE